VAGDGWSNARVRSRAAAMAVSRDEDWGMVTWVGNQASVSAMRSADVSTIHTQ
jgi:hypothetical protein